MTTKFGAVNGAVENALTQISSTRARAEEATGIYRGVGVCDWLLESGDWAVIVC